MRKPGFPFSVVVFCSFSSRDEALAEFPLSMLTCQLVFFIIVQVHNFLMICINTEMNRGFGEFVHTEMVFHDETKL